MKVLLVIMTGIGFTLGVVFGLLLHLPSDSHPAQKTDHLLNQQQQLQDARIKRHASISSSSAHANGNYEIKSSYDPSSSSLLGKKSFGQTNIGVVQSLQISDWDTQADIRLFPQKPRAESGERLTNLRVNSPDKWRSLKSGQRSLSLSKQKGRVKDKVLSDSLQIKSNTAVENPGFSQGLEFEGNPGKTGLNLSPVESPSSTKDVEFRKSNSSRNVKGEEDKATKKEKNTFVESFPSLEDKLYMSSIIHNKVYWSKRAENLCQKAFTGTDTEAWRSKVQGLDVVKMETGCGRMQNRLLTFRDSSKACARYRLNTDQIQGDIFSYYLAKLLNIPNLPPTILSSVNSVDQKWRTVHLDLSLAQWADSKLVVLTKFIDGLKPAHIPNEFRDERRKLLPILDHLGSKSQAELCELMQWSDLIVFDYLTANLDRVINNMFNSQWNDQMMSSPTHNLEKFADGGLVFLDNESGLFHGFRLIDKYEKLHRSLLDSVCVFRSSTADVVKRLATSGSVGKELRDLLESNEPLAKHVPSMPAKNVKILERRLQQVYKQIIKCENEFEGR